MKEVSLGVRNDLRKCYPSNSIYTSVMSVESSPAIININSGIELIRGGCGVSRWDGESIEDWEQGKVKMLLL